MMPVAGSMTRCFRVSIQGGKLRADADTTYADASVVYTSMKEAAAFLNDAEDGTWAMVEAHGVNLQVLRLYLVEMKRVKVYSGECHQ